MLPGPGEGLVVARHGHGDETDGYGAGFCWRRVEWLVVVSGEWEAERRRAGKGVERRVGGGSDRRRRGGTRYLFSPSWVEG